MCPVSLFIKVFSMNSSCSFTAKATLPFSVNLCSLYLSSVVVDVYIFRLTKMICLREICVCGLEHKPNESSFWLCLRTCMLLPIQLCFLSTKKPALKTLYVKSKINISIHLWLFWPSSF